MFGKLTLDAVPYHEPIVMVTVAGIILGGLALLALITYFGKWKYLWTEWLTSVDHKRLGIMYIIVAFVMLLRGFADAIMMRPDLHRSRRYHDLLRSDAVRGRSDERRCAVANRCSRRCLPIPE